MSDSNNDGQLISAILEGGNARQKAIRQIYDQRDMREGIIRFVQQNNGNFQDGQDAFHEGIIILDRNIREGKFRGDSSLRSYLFSICKLHWMNQLRKKGRVDLKEDSVPFDSPTGENPEVLMLEEEQKSLLQRALQQLSEHCRRILELWQLSYSMEEIAAQTGIENADLARKHKYRCHHTLVEFIKTQPGWQTALR